MDYINFEEFMTKKEISFNAFLRRCFHELLPTDILLYGWYIGILSEMLEKVENNEIKRLIVCMPPRHLKSVTVSTAFPAWLIGKDPTKKVIVASYAMPLAEKLSVDTKNLVVAPWYIEMFPSVEWSTDVNSKKKFKTTDGGFRLATSINGSLTGEGGDVLIADDPQKPLNIFSKKYREKTHDWFLNTFLSRLNNKKKGSVIIVMQRLHQDDLIGRLTKHEIFEDILQECNGWFVLNLALIAERLEPFRIQNDILNSESISLEEAEKIKQEMGQQHFQAQYQQNPSSSSGGIVPKNFIHFSQCNWKALIQNGVFVSVDVAQKCGEDNDFTAISLWVVEGSSAIMFECINTKMEIDELLKVLRGLFIKYSVCKMLIEDKGSGTAVIQTMRSKFSSQIEAIGVRASKFARLYLAMPFFEKKTILFHESLKPEVMRQLLDFPNTKHDDIVDSITQFAYWFGSVSERECIEPRVVSV